MRLTSTGTSTRWPGPTFRARSSRSCAGAPAMWWPTAIASDACSWSAMPRIKTILRADSASTPAWAMSTISAGPSLAASLRGWGRPGLLDSYELERRPVGVRNLNQAYTGHADNRDRPSHPDIMKDTAEGAQARARMREQILASQPAMVLTDGIALGYRYDQSPIVVPDGTPPTPDTISLYVPTARPGSRAPHAWITEARSTVDLFGGGFVLLRLGNGAPSGEAIEAAFRRREVPLEIVPIAD